MQPQEMAATGDTSTLKIYITIFIIFVEKKRILMNCFAI